MAKSEEVNYKKNFCQKYFGKDDWDLDVLHEVDVLLKDKRGDALLYIESKFQIVNKQEYRRALAQVILTNKKQDNPLNKVALIYQNSLNDDILDLIDCSENPVLYNNDINWAKEKASQPSKDAIDRINDRIRGHITQYCNDEIHEFYRLLKQHQDTAINITESNFNVVYSQWKNEVLFREKIENEQDLINLFLVDILNGTVYKKSLLKDLEENTLFGKEKVGEFEEDIDQDLIREGTNLSHYQLMRIGEKVDGIKYQGIYSSNYYTIADNERYDFFWRKYKRPPEKHEFLKILERSATLYSEKYRKDTGGEYTPTCFVEKQNEILAQHYNLDDFIVFDPCAGVGNLENQFGKDFKRYCYLSTLEQMDVDICKIKGFENAVQYDYLKNDKHPKFKYKGQELEINEICQRENRKLMVVMNPPYQRVEGYKNDLAIEFFNKVVTLKPDVVVYYFKTERFLSNDLVHFIKSGYKIVSHIFSNAKDTFLLSEWPISQVIFDKIEGDAITMSCVKTDRYELDKKRNILSFCQTHIYDNVRPQLVKSIEERIKENQRGLIIGQWCYLTGVLIVSNGGKEKNNKITTKNLLYCLLSKGINFNTHPRYYEFTSHVLLGNYENIPKEIISDAICFSLFYKGNLFSNKEQKNYIMPFMADELGCGENDLNVLFDANGGDLFSSAEPPFDFREWLKQFEFSNEAKELYNAALEIFKFYHRNPDYADGRDWNDSFYDITNAIMGKDASSFKEFETDNDTRISKTKTTKGTKGFGRNTIKYVVGSEYLPIFEHFFDARDVLARKINRQLVEQGLLLWERENIY